MLKIFVILCLAVKLTACTAEDEVAPSPVNIQPVFSPVVNPALLHNSQVSCGDWSQQLTEFIPPYKINKHQRWLVMGSSSAAGAGASVYRNSWAGKLTEYGAGEGLEILNIARGGYTTYHALSSRCDVNALRFQPDANHNINKALDLNPDLVVISFPSNDAAMAYSAEETAYNLLLMRELLAREDVATVLIGAQPRNMAASKQRLLTRLDALLVERMPACLVQVYKPLMDGAGNLSADFDAGDGVHLNDAGHALIFERLLSVLQDPAQRCIQ